MPGSNVLLAGAILLAAAGSGAPYSFSLLDYWQRKCHEGDQQSCARLAASKPEAEQAARLQRDASQFGARVDRAELEENNRPRLRLAYLEVMRDYFAREPALARAGLHYDETLMKSCADHFDHYWLHRKMWWPIDDRGRPDWPDIYLYIVDHYEGYCLKTVVRQNAGGR